MEEQYTCARVEQYIKNTCVFVQVC